MRCAVFLLLCILATACQPLTAQQSARMEVPEIFISAGPDAEVSPSDRWWLDFSDEALNDLQHQLFANNLSLRQALFRIDQLEARQGLVNAQLWPSLHLNASSRREQNVGQGGETRTTGSRFAVAAAYEVDLWQRLRNRSTAAELRLTAGEDEVRALMLSLSARLVDLYFLAVEQKAQIALLNDRIAHHQTLVRLISERYQSGLSTAAELYQARQNLAQLQATLPQHQTNLVQAENAIAVLLGQPPGGVKIERLELPPLVDIISVGLPASLLHRRPDISAALLELAATDHDLAAALADRLPRLDLSANIGRSVTRLASGDVTGTFWSLALGVAQPLFDGGRLQAAADQQQALRHEKLAAAQLKLLTAIEEVESALDAERNSALRADSLKQQQEFNRHTLQLRRDNYLLGLSDSLELLRSEMDQLAIRSQSLSNHRQWLSHRISLVRALGGHWMDGELTQQRQNLSHNAAETGRQHF